MLDPRVAVVVGRFQIDKIHRGHEIFLSTVLSKHDNLVIFVGVHSGQNTKNNPMGYLPRAQMLRNALKELSKDHSSALVTIEPLPDMSDDTAWSKELDRRIAELYPRCKVVLYGGRDSCLM
jgi:cytidyltransferase-like protein